MEPGTPAVGTPVALEALIRVAAESTQSPIAILWTLDDLGVQTRAVAGTDPEHARALLSDRRDGSSALEVPLPLEYGIPGAICVLDLNQQRSFTPEHRQTLAHIARAAGALLAEEGGRPSRYDALLEATAFADVAISVFSIGPNDTTPVCEYRSAGSRDTSEFYALGTNDHALPKVLDHARRDDRTPFECRLTDLDQHTYWIEVSVRKLSPGDKQPLRYMVIAREITARKHAEEQSHLLAAAIEEQPAGVLIVNLQGAHWLRPPIVYVNAGFSALTGYSLEDIRAGVYPLILGEKSDREIVRNAAKRVFDGEQVTVELQLYHRNGTPFWAEVRAHALESPRAYAVLIINDISGRRAKDNWMRMLTEAIDQASDFVTIFADSDYSTGGPKLKYANRAFFEATQYEPGELLGRPYTAFYSPRNDAVVLDAIRDSIEAGLPNFREVLAQRKDGSEFWIEFVSKPIVDSDGRALRLSIGRDITLRRRATNHLTLLLAAFEQSPSRVVLYETNQHDELEVAYENEASYVHGHRRLLELWNDQRQSSRAVRARLMAGERVHLVFSDRDVRGIPNLVDFVAISVRNASRLEAVLTFDHVIADATVDESERSRLLELAMLVQACREARDEASVLVVLRALLLDRFEAEVGFTTLPVPSGVSIDASARQASFTLGARSYLVSWATALEERDLTALRFCIEVCVEHAQTIARTTS